MREEGVIEPERGADRRGGAALRQEAARTRRSRNDGVGVGDRSGQPHHEDEGRHARTWRTRPSTWSTWRATWCWRRRSARRTTADTATLVDSVMAAQINLTGGGQRGDDRGGGGGQGLSRGRDARDCADALDVRTYIPEPKRPHRSTLDGQAGGAAAGRGEQPPAGEAGQGQEAAAAAERGGRADVRAHLRDGRGAAELAPRVGRRDASGT